MLTMAEAAKWLDGREYRNETTREFVAQLKEAGLVAVYPASDDLTEFEGAFNDETGKGDIRLLRDGLLTNECDNDRCPHFKRLVKALKPPFVSSSSDVDDSGAWAVTTHLPHETFVIYEDGELYGKGLVISITDLPTLG